MVNSDEADIFENQILTFLKGKRYAGHVCHPIIRISSLTREPGQVNQLKMTIEDLVQDQQYNVPLSWFKMKETLKETKKAWLDWRTVQDKAKHVGIRHKGKLRAALQFFHSIGELVYFEEVPDFIVIDPQWLIDMLSRVITIPSHYRRINKHWEILETEALLHEDAMKEVWPEGAVQGLVAIMMKYALLLPVSADYKLRDPSKSIPPGKVYLVPSLLPAKGSDETHQPADTPEGTAPPVTLVFPDNFIPVGLTSRLITSLCNYSSWKAVGQVYKDTATFKVMKKGKFSVFQKSGEIKISSGKSPPKNDHKALQTILASLKKLSPHQDIKVCISCPDCQSPVPTAGPEETLDDVYTCHNGHSFPPFANQLWFKRKPTDAFVSLTIYHRFIGISGCIFCILLLVFT